MPLSWPSWLSLVRISAGVNFDAIDGNRVPFLKADFDDGGLIGGIFRADGARIDIFLGRHSRVFQHAPLG